MSTRDQSGNRQAGAGTDVPKSCTLPAELFLHDPISSSFFLTNYKNAQNTARARRKRAPTPLPWAQLSILLILQLAEPFTSQVINPFAPDLIRNIGITGGDEAKVGYYVGMMQSLFFATQAVTVLHWSRISDHVGRRPVIMTGLLGLSMSMYCFGLSRTFWGLVFSRMLNGALNGNIGVLKSMIAEITDSTNLTRAYAYLPISWLLGSTLGPMIGGALSRPAEQFPDTFGHSEFMKKYPYFLACAVPATFSAIAFLVTLFFLKETVKDPLSIRSFLTFHKAKNVPADPNILDGPKPSGITSGKPLPLRELLVPRVLVAGGNYALLAIVDIAFRAMQPVWMSTPIELGGLGMTPQMIGSILAVYGVSNGLLQIMFFSRVTERLGAKMVYIIGIAVLLPIFALFPVINMFARTEGLSAIVWVGLATQSILSVATNFCYGSVFIFMTASSPNKASLGSVNGLAQMCVSVMRAVGPAAANSLFSLSIDSEHHYLGGMLVYVVLGVLTCVALYVSSFLPTKVWNDEEPEER
ncbi:MFS general substrate transporter [Amylocystis lapponica]|nr:MFS general substrate transporter [Amylocystis lapponica]